MKPVTTKEIIRDFNSLPANISEVQWVIYRPEYEAAVAELVEALEDFRLGHEHAPNLKHTRAMGDTYGWCDICSTKVSWGEGEAEKALAKFYKVKAAQ